MTEFGEIVQEEVDASIEDGINHICKVLTALKSDDSTNFVDDKVRIQLENEAERQAKAMIAAGFSFNAVTVENVRFVINGAGEIQKYDPRQEDCDFPF